MCARMNSRVYARSATTTPPGGTLKYLFVRMSSLACAGLLFSHKGSPGRGDFYPVHTHTPAVLIRTVVVVDSSIAVKRTGRKVSVLSTNTWASYVSGVSMVALASAALTTLNRGGDYRRQSGTLERPRRSERFGATHCRHYARSTSRSATRGCHSWTDFYNQTWPKIRSRGVRLCACT